VKKPLRRTVTLVVAIIAACSLSASPAMATGADETVGLAGLLGKIPTLSVWRACRTGCRRISCRTPRAAPGIQPAATSAPRRRRPERCARSPETSL
jgi:hypothetical protein